jgi:hypothetical protein
MTPELFAVARAIHMARAKECSFNGHDGYSGLDAFMRRHPWPEDRKEATRLYQAGQPHMDLAVAQARAAIKELGL